MIACGTKEVHRFNKRARLNPVAGQQGFTLIELVLVILILGIIALASTQYIVNSVRGMSDVSQRDVLANTLAVSMEKMQRALQRQLPHSLRLRTTSGANANQCIELIPVRATAFISPSVDSVGAVNDLSVYALTTNVERHFAVINPSTEIYQQWEGSRLAISGRSTTRQVSSRIIRQTTTAQAKVKKAAPETRLTFVSAQRFSGNVAQPYVYFIDSPVSYCLVGDRLYRYQDYPPRARQPSVKQLPQQEPQRVLLAQGLTDTSGFQWISPERTSDAGQVGNKNTTELQIILTSKRQSGVVGEVEEISLQQRIPVLSRGQAGVDLSWRLPNRGKNNLNVDSINNSHFNSSLFNTRHVNTRHINTRHISNRGDQNSELAVSDGVTR